MSPQRPVPPPVRPGNRHPSAPERQRESQRPREIGGPKGPEPTRYGDWERGGRCIDF